MQTFLISDSTDFSVTAQALDNKRLNKQALEAWQIMLTNLQLDPSGNFRKPKGWVNHPAVKMWRGYEPTLFVYIEAMVKEWIERGYSSTILDKASKTLKTGFDKKLIKNVFGVPYWMRDQILFSNIVASHRTALLVKNYDWYSRYGWSEDSGVAPEGYEYVWA